ASAPDWKVLAARITTALRLAPDERVLMRYDASYFAELIPALRERIPAAKTIRSDEPLTDAVLDQADVFLWLPLGSLSAKPPTEGTQALVQWLGKGGPRREIHFHWREGSVNVDGLAGEHSASLVRMYREALDIDYRALGAAQDRAIALLRQGTLRV